MNRWRKLLVASGLVVGLSGGLVLATGGVAFAHRPVVSGTTACADGDHLITWSIGNNLKKQPMTITSASAELDTNSTTYAVTGYTSPVVYGTPTSASSTIPGNLTGTVTLTVVGTWPDGISNPKTAVVTLDESCSTTTTTSPTTTAPSTTTSPPTTVVAPPTTWTDTTGGSQCVGPTGTDTAGSCLAFTAGGTHTSGEKQLGWGLLIAGALAVAAGGSSHNRRRRHLHG